MSNTSTYPQGPLLSKINSPDDLRKLNKNQLEQISSELRRYIIDIVSDGFEETKGIPVIFMTSILS